MTSEEQKALAETAAARAQIMLDTAVAHGLIAPSSETDERGRMTYRPTARGAARATLESFQIALRPAAREQRDLTANEREQIASLLETFLMFLRGGIDGNHSAC